MLARIQELSLYLYRVVQLKIFTHTLSSWYVLQKYEIYHVRLYFNKMVAKYNPLKPFKNPIKTLKIFWGFLLLQIPKEILEFYYSNNPCNFTEKITSEKHSFFRKLGCKCIYMRTSNKTYKIYYLSYRSNTVGIIWYYFCPILANLFNSRTSINPYKPCKTLFDHYKSHLSAIKFS